MIIGICCLVSFRTNQIYQYALQSYDLALAQAIELQKGVLYHIIENPEIKGDNGYRIKSFYLPEALEVITITETEVGDKVLEVK